MSQALERDSFEQRRLITKAEVLMQIPISTATMWREISAGRFPKPVRVGARRIAFFQTEIDAWLAQRVAERDAKSELPRTASARFGPELKKRGA